ncbi:MAG: preprotein translocase subunit SecG [Succinivibrio sp.]|nr:preprotein translocase subunit SecG [Succinivibrio sp.]MCI7773192.1 preprotein translocase subunit SecG [Succinivibrio sp.]MCI7785328.1 preprotein translocase subunit SecG [Succinivibrio sp.]
MLFQIAIVVLLLVAVAMIALILLQQGKGAGMGASFGAGASNTVFGSVGSGNFLTRSTWFLIFVFFGICLLLGYLQKSQHEQVSNFSNIEETSEQASETPVVNTDAPVVNTDAPAVTESKTDVPATK